MAVACPFQPIGVVVKVVETSPPHLDRHRNMSSSTHNHRARHERCRCDRGVRWRGQEAGQQRGLRKGANLGLSSMCQQLSKKGEGRTWNTMGRDPAHECLCTTRWPHMRHQATPCVDHGLHMCAAHMLCVGDGAAPSGSSPVEGSSRWKSPILARLCGYKTLLSEDLKHPFRRTPCR